MFIPELMGYREYFLDARAQYPGPKPSLDRFYRAGIISVDEEVTDDHQFRSAIDKIGANVIKYFDDQVPESNSLLVYYSDAYHLLTTVGDLADVLVPWLEQNLYGCHLFIDLVSAYRSLPACRRRMSWLWHYDDNPNEVFKVIIYLTAVTNEESAPFEYLVGPDGDGIVTASSRMGPKCWQAGAYRTRISATHIRKYIHRGCRTVKLLGPKGTTIAFSNNLIHRANIPAPGCYRDALILRIRPSL